MNNYTVGLVSKIVLAQDGCSVSDPNDRTATIVELVDQLTQQGDAAGLRSVHDELRDIYTRWESSEIGVDLLELGQYVAASIKQTTRTNTRQQPKADLRAARQRLVG